MTVLTAALGFVLNAGVTVLVSFMVVTMPRRRRVEPPVASGGENGGFRTLRVWPDTA